MRSMDIEVKTHMSPETKRLLGAEPREDRLFGRKMWGTLIGTVGVLLSPIVCYIATVPELSGWIASLITGLVLGKVSWQGAKDLKGKVPALMNTLEPKAPEESTEDRGQEAEGAGS